MADPSDKKVAKISLIRLLPNMLTLTAICAGLSAIRFGVQGNYVLAVQLILAACVLDGLDGRAARLLRIESKIGAELDSLADFLNFGVAPPLILYFWALQDIRSLAWISVLIFTLCCVMRLARFNVSSRSERPGVVNAYFEGIPSPAAALLVMMPMYVSFAFTDAKLLHPVLICIYMMFIGYLMISRVPTWSFKTSRIPRDNASLVLIGVCGASAAVLTFAWETLIVLCLCYVGVVIWGLFEKRRRANR